MLIYRSASPGYWTIFLLPLAFFLTTDVEGGNDRPPWLLAIVFVNSVLLAIYHGFVDDNSFTRLLEPLKILAMLLFVCVMIYAGVFGIGAETSLYELITFVLMGAVFPYVFKHVVRYFPRSFTFGEALVVTQGFVFTFCSAVRHLPFPPQDLTNATEPTIIFIFVQGGFLILVLACRFLVIAKIPWTFEFSDEFICIWTKCSLIAIAFRLSRESLYYLFNWVPKFFIVSKQRAFLCEYSVALILVALGVVAWKHYRHSTTTNVSTAYRKYFHFLIVAVYLPAILYDLNMLHICSSAVMYILVFLEVVRFLNFNVLRVIPVGKFIDSKVGIFRDHQDEGRLIITPLYLMAGCSLPIWLIGLKTSSRNLSSDLLAAAMSGILSIGIGDTFASIGGSKYGRIKWKGSKKSLEGTICSILSQVFFMVALVFSGVCTINLSTLLAVFGGICINALVEGTTDQIDNLILPLVTLDFVLGTSYILKAIGRS